MQEFNDMYIDGTFGPFIVNFAIEQCNVVY